MYATMHRTEQWLSHHHLALGALIVLLAVVIIGLARSIVWVAPAPTAPEMKAPSAAYSAAVTRYQALKAAQADLQDRTAAIVVPGPAADARQRYLGAKETQAEMQDRTAAIVVPGPAADARQRYLGTKETQAELRDSTTAVAAPSALIPTAAQRYQDLKERQAETQDRSTAPLSSLVGPVGVQRYESMKERQAELRDRAVAVSGPTMEENAQYGWRMTRLAEMNTSGDPELDAGLLPGAYADTRSEPH